jgi:hypothetical protein
LFPRGIKGEYSKTTRYLVALRPIATLTIKTHLLDYSIW